MAGLYSDNGNAMSRSMSLESGGGDDCSAIDDVDSRTNFGKRLGRALSRVDFEHCDPPTCVSVLHFASVQVLHRYHSFPSTSFRLILMNPQTAGVSIE